MGTRYGKVTIFIRLIFGHKHKNFYVLEVTFLLDILIRNIYNNLIIYNFFQLISDFHRDENSDVSTARKSCVFKFSKLLEL